MSAAFSFNVAAGGRHVKRKGGRYQLKRALNPAAADHHHDYGNH
jgi:hypothetical protein